MTPEKLYDLVQKCLECPWLIRCAQTLGQKDRRGRRVREPTPSPNAVIYKPDGASRGHGRSEESHAGCGAAVWAATIEGVGEGPPHATFHEYQGPGISNNVAEYETAAPTRTLNR